MNKTPKISLLAPLSFIVSRFQITLFFLFVMAGLIASVTLLNSIISDTTASKDYTSPISAGTIDQATLDRLRALHTSQTPTAPETHPSGRINPFTE
jgi:hypothetical protein